MNATGNSIEMPCRLPDDVQIAQAAIDARDAALISGAPAWDAAWIGIETIERLVREQMREQLGISPATKPA